MEQPIRPKAFISCSLRNEDKEFVDFVEATTVALGFEPFGTVGKYSAAPEPLWKQMRDGIRQADCIVMAVTPRYLQEDIHNKEKTGQSISEMLHFEMGMAVYKGIPIIAIATDFKTSGDVLPQITSVIQIDHRDEKDVIAKWHLVQSTFRGALTIIKQKWEKSNKREVREAATGLMALVGVFAVVYGVILILSKIIKRK